MNTPHYQWMKDGFRRALLALVPAVLVACGGGGGSNTVVADNGDAPSTAARSTPLPAGDADCPNGGILVETGIDENKNGVLDDSEVDNSNKLCNGLDGADGSNGADGTDGVDGNDGADGLNALVSMTLEPAGANCPYKGIRIDSGQDANNNGVLDPAEISDTRYVCNLIDGQIGWQVAERIETDNAGDVHAPQIALDANGNALAVWRRYDGSRYNIWANRYTAGSGWGTAELIETDNAGDASDPQIALDANGNALAVWDQSDGIRFSIWANRYTAGSGWGTPELIENDNAGGAYFPQIAIDASGNALAVWKQFDGSRNNIWANRYTPGSGWGTAELIETDDAGDARYPQIALAANGNALAVWLQFDGTRNNIWANRYTPGSGWGTPELIETDDASNAYTPQIAIDASGNAMAVWRQSDGSRYNIWANRYTPGSGWGAAGTIESGTGDAYDPQIALDTNGNALAVWLQSDGIRYNIWANRYTAGSGWGTAELIETGGGDAVSPQIALDANGNALAVWRQSQSGGTRYNIWANRYTAGNGWGYAERIETDDAGDARYPQIALDANGNAMAVWRQSDGSRTNIWANRWIAP